MHKKAIIIAPLVDVRDDVAPLATQLLYGDCVGILHAQNNLYLVKNERDGYEGWVDAKTVSTDIFIPSHHVVSQASYIYNEPRVTIKPTRWVPFMGRIRLDITRKENGYIYAPDLNGWIYSKTVNLLSDIEPDYVASAEQFLNTPYLYGGCSYRGIDCSSLVQLSLYRAGISAPRDTKDQINQIGTSIVQDNLKLNNLKRGDIIFFKGHVGIMIDGEHMIHANATAMRVSIDHLDVYNQILVKKSAEPITTAITAIKRL